MKDIDYRYIPEDERRAVAEKLLEPTRGVSEAAQVGRALGRAVLDGRGARRLGEMLVSSADDLRESYERGYDAGFADGSENRPQGSSDGNGAAEVTMEGDGFKCASCGATWPYVRAAEGARLEIGLFCPMCASRLIVSSDKARARLAEEDQSEQMDR